MTFRDDTVPVQIDPAGLYHLTADVVYQGRDETFTVPAGFVTDLASVPRCLTWLVPIAGVHDRAAIVHDWLCTQLDKPQRRPDGTWINIPPANAVDTDGIFRRILRELGVPLVRRWLFYVGVRWGALANPARRAGWWRTAPAVLGVTALALPVVGPALLLVLLVLAVDRVVEGVVR